jgi:hypothetical protein
MPFSIKQIKDDVKKQLDEIVSKYSFLSDETKTSDQTYDVDVMDSDLQKFRKLHELLIDINNKHDLTHIQEQYEQILNPPKTPKYNPTERIKLKGVAVEIPSYEELQAEIIKYQNSFIRFNDMEDFGDVRNYEISPNEDEYYDGRTYAFDTPELDMKRLQNALENLILKRNMSGGFKIKNDFKKNTKLPLDYITLNEQLNALRKTRDNMYCELFRQCVKEKRFMPKPAEPKSYNTSGWVESKDKETGKTIKRIKIWTDEEIYKIRLLSYFENKNSAKPFENWWDVSEVIESIMCLQVMNTPLEKIIQQPNA